MISDTQELEKEFTKYEIARILGARALQIAMDAPLLYKIPKEELEEIKYDPIKIAEIELKGKVLPITVNRPLPRNVGKEDTGKKQDKNVEDEGKKEETHEVKEAIKDKEIEKNIDHEEEPVEKEIEKDDEIMELAKPDDEFEEFSSEDGGTIDREEVE